MFIGLLIIAFSLMAQTAVAPAGEGTEANPYQIATWQNLYWISQNTSSWNKHFIQMVDIDFADATPAITTWNYGHGWTPLGSNWDSFFLGKYNGNNKTISGIYINRQSSVHQGFFGFIYSGAEIKNLGIVNITVNGSNNTGGLVGYNGGCSITNCYSSGNVTGGDYTGGLVGHNSGTILNSYSTCNVTGNEKTGGLIGSIYRGVITNSYYNYEQVLINNNHTITIGALTNELFNAWIPNKSLDIDSYLTSDDSYYLINSVNDFKTLLAFGQLSYSFKLNSNIDLSTEHNFYIPYFKGTFNGNSHTISDLTINMPYLSYIGLFGTINGAEITNLGLVDINMTGMDYTGGMVGQNYEGMITNCYSTGYVTGDGRAGGLIGLNTASITNCYSSVNVTGNGYSGGLVGQNYEGVITNCYSTGNVTGTGSYTGGLTGGADYGAITKCYSTGNVTGTGYCTGGLLGHNFSPIFSCYSTGNVIGNNVAGGLIGENHIYSNLINCYSTGNVTGTGSYTGGLVGSGDATTNLTSFWDIETSGQSTSAGGTGKTTAQMKMQSTYTNAGWSFPDTWNINPNMNNGYPYLNYPNSVPNDEIVIDIPHCKEVVLHSAYPNPFNPSTTIAFDLISPSDVKIDIYNVKGQLVKNLVHKAYQTGSHTIVWDGRDYNGNACGTGVYLYKMTADKTIQTKKMMMIK